MLAGCATYTDQTASIRNQVLHGQTTEAIAALEKSSVASRKRDEVLFRMERGMLHYLSGNYEKANKDWERSYYRSEELYTTSISNTAASLAVSEDLTDYPGEEHERVFVPIFSALSYFALGNLNAALVEIRRAYNLISKLKLDTDEQSSRIDGFPFLISGLLYESNKNWDSAIIEYRKALKHYQTKFNERNSGITKLTADSLWRIAEFRGRNEIIKQLSESGFTKPADSLVKRNSQGEVIVLIESGQSPIKIPRDYPIQHDEGVINISFPAYQAITRTNPTTRVTCNESDCEVATIATDIGVLAEKALEQRRLRDLTKMAARILLKEGSRRAARKQFGELGGFAVMVANAVTERADTRSWTLLPENIQIARIPVTADVPMKISVNLSNTVNSGQWNVKLSPGSKQILRIRSLN